MENGEILCTDGLFVPWPHSSARAIGLSSHQVRALRSTHALSRVLAHEVLTPFQIRRLYTSNGARLRATALRRLALRIRASRLEALCEGIGERALTIVFGRTTDRAALVAALAQQETHAPEDPPHEDDEAEDRD